MCDILQLYQHLLKAAGTRLKCLPGHPPLSYFKPMWPIYHSGLNLHKCDCLQKFRSKWIDQKWVKRILLCRSCNKSFSRAEHFNRHQLIHIGEKVHKRTHCDYSTTQATCLITNYKRENNHNCAQCKKSFGQASTLRTHMLSSPTME